MPRGQESGKIQNERINATKSVMNISLRAARDEDFEFTRDVYFATMRWIIESLFGWDQVREEENFARFFKLDEVRIIIADGRNVGWIQEQVADNSINLGSFYLIQEMQRQGIGTQVLRTVLAHAADQSKAVTLAVVKINPARRFYERHGFRVIHEDEHKFYMRFGA
jgi:GNAT superfamily N-acetyltransferase